MATTVGCFLVVAASSGLALVAGLHLGQRSEAKSRVGLAVGLVLLALWAYLVRQPVVALQLIPVNLFSYIEGIGAVPIFMLVVGIAWGRGQLPRQKRTAMWASLLGVAYLVYGGLWMLQTTPVAGFADAVERGPIRQSQDYSCVPAACATALNALGVYTSEAEMARLTHTRPGTGATMIRAMNGLSRRLSGTSIRVELIQPTYQQLLGIPLPALTPLQYATTRRHMVTILDVTKDGVLIADPVDVQMLLQREHFEQVYCKQVLVFRRR